MATIDLQSLPWVSKGHYILKCKDSFFIAQTENAAHKILISWDWRYAAFLSYQLRRYVGTCRRREH